MIKKAIKKCWFRYCSKKKNITIRNVELPGRMVRQCGSGVYIGSKVLVAGDPSDIKIGENTYIHGGYIYHAQIGKFCSLGYGITIGPGVHDMKRISTYPLRLRYLKEEFPGEFKESLPAVIKNDVWIGNGAVIMQGVTVGNGAVIAAGSVVTRDVPAYAVAAGVPARIMKYRFSEEVIAALEELRWWDRGYEWIETHKDLLYLHDVEAEELRAFIESES